MAWDVLSRDVLSYILCLYISSLKMPFVQSPYLNNAFGFLLDSSGTPSPVLADQPGPLSRSVKLRVSRTCNCLTLVLC